MSISRQNLTVIIVSFMSERVIHDCINSVPKDIKIIVVDNSNNKYFKDEIEKKYNNVRCILSENNLGMGAGNNYGLNEIDTDYGFIIRVINYKNLNVLRYRVNTVMYHFFTHKAYYNYC